MLRILGSQGVSGVSHASHPCYGSCIQDLVDGGLTAVGFKAWIKGFYVLRCDVQGFGCAALGFMLWIWLGSGFELSGSGFEIWGFVVSGYAKTDKMWLLLGL